MQYKQVEKDYFIYIEKNEKVMDTITRFCKEQGIKNANLSVKEAAEIDDMTKDAHKEEECDENIVVKTEEEMVPPAVKSSEEMSEEIQSALSAVLGEEAAERVMAKMEEDITEAADTLAAEREAKMEEIKKSKIAATQEEIDSLKAKLEAIKNDEGEVIEGEEKKPDEDGDGVPDVCRCVGDVVQDDVVDTQDLIYVIDHLGDDDGAADADGNGVVDIIDILVVLDGWGVCGV